MIVRSNEGWSQASTLCTAAAIFSPRLRVQMIAETWGFAVALDMAAPSVDRFGHGPSAPRVDHLGDDPQVVAVDRPKGDDRDRVRRGAQRYPCEERKRIGDQQH